MKACKNPIHPTRYRLPRAVVTPLAHSLDLKESPAEEESHYCEISKGPCKHGDACPLKDKHHKDKGPREMHAKGHSKTKGDKTKGSAYLASQCHEGESEALSTSFHFVRFTVTTTELPPRQNRTDQEIIFEDSILYKNKVVRLLERPPEEPLYRS